MAGQTSREVMPAAFLGHGSPVNTIDDNRYTRSWRAFAAAVPAPRAVLVVSAHWYTAVTAVTAMARPRTIHDLFGFGPRLQTFQYPAPGSPEIAREIRDVVKPRFVGLDEDAWGLDHGTWSVMAHVFPDANVPVIQLSINGTKDFAYHLDIGERLAALRERGILIIGSGNVVHNLGRIDTSLRDGGFDWAVRFDEAAREIMTSRPAEVLSLKNHPDFARAAPTPDHFIPLLYIAGLAKSSGRAPRILVDGYALGSLSMTSYVLDCDCPGVDTTQAPVTDPLPDPDVVPPDQTNM
jgi:4,5-DOPA dioxygenase extradiol